MDFLKIFGPLSITVKRVLGDQRAVVVAGDQRVVVAVVAEAVAVGLESLEVEEAGRLEILPAGGEEEAVVVFALFLFGMDLLGQHAQVDRQEVQEQPLEHQ